MHEDWDPDHLYEIVEYRETPGPFNADCAFCTGTGVHPASMKSLSFEQCPACRGQGIIRFTQNRSDYDVCPQCHGSGKDTASTIPSPCRGCRGSGIVEKKQQPV
jgi:DnaJ-class molecular chaperone